MEPANHPRHRSTDGSRRTEPRAIGRVGRDRRSALTALALVVTLTAAACGGDDSTSSDDAASATSVGTPNDAGSSTADETTTPSPETEPAAPSTPAIGPDLVSAAIDGLGTFGPELTGAATCPLGDPAAIAASLGSDIAYVDIDNDFRNRGYRCVARIDGSEPFVAVSLEAHVDVADVVDSYPDQVAAARPFDGGIIVSTCPWDSTDPSENCKAIWLDDARSLAVAFAQSAGDATSGFAVEALRSALPGVLAELAARSNGAVAAPDTPAVAVPGCGANLAASSLSRFCGVTGSWQTTTGWSFGDDGNATSLSTVSNTAGAERFFGALRVDGVVVGYFLATGSRDQPTIVDLVDVPVGAADYRTDEFEPEIRILDDAGSDLVVYTVVDDSLA